MKKSEEVQQPEVKEKVVYVVEKPKKKSHGCLILLCVCLIPIILVGVISTKALPSEPPLKSFSVKPLKSFSVKLQDTTVCITSRMTKGDVIDILGKPSSYSEGGYFECLTYSVWSNFGGIPIPGAHYTIEFEDGYVSGVSKY